jgi:hypothetical protein
MGMQTHILEVIVPTEEQIGCATASGASLKTHLSGLCLGAHAARRRIMVRRAQHPA